MRETRPALLRPRFLPGLTCLLSLLGAGRLPAAPLLPFGPEIPVHVQTLNAPLAPQVAVFPDGSFVLAWTVVPGGGKPTALRARLFDAGGAAASGGFGLAQPFNQLLDALAVTANGFVAVWDQVNGRGLSSVFARTFDRTGNPLGAPFKVHADSAANRYGARVATGPSGGFVVAWTADATVASDPNFHADTHARFFDAGGNPNGPELVIAEGSPTDHSQDFPRALAVAPDGTLAIATQFVGDGVSIEVRRFDAAGNLLQLLDPYPPGTCCIGNQFDPALSMAADGSFVVAWATGTPNQTLSQNASAILARRFSAAGVPLGADVFQVNKRGGYEVTPLLASLPGGGFVAVWSDDNGRDGDGFGVFGRSFNADGTPASRDFQLNLATAGDQIASSLAAGADGQAVAAWSQSAPGAAPIVARRLRMP